MLVAKNMVCAGFTADVALVVSVCVLHMSDANVGLPLSTHILAGHHGACLQPCGNGGCTILAWHHGHVFASMEVHSSWQGITLTCLQPWGFTYLGMVTSCVFLWILLGHISQPTDNAHACVTRFDSTFDCAHLGGVCLL